MTSDIELIEYGTPFSYDQRNKELFVTHNDFSFVVKEDMENLCYYVFTWIKDEKSIGKVVDFLDECKEKRRYLSDFKLEKYTLTCTIKKEANTGLNTVNLNIFVKDLAKWLAENMYISCCSKCGDEIDIFLDHDRDKAFLICNDCKHGRAKVFEAPGVPAQKPAESKPASSVDIFDLSDLIPSEGSDDDISSSGDEAVLPMSKHEDEKPDMERFESVSLEDDILPELTESKTEAAPEAPAPVMEEKKPEFVEAPKATEPVPEAAPAPKDEMPDLSELLTPVSEKPAEPEEHAAPAPKAAPRPAMQEIAFEEMLTPVESKPAPAAKPEKSVPKAETLPDLSEVLKPVAPEKVEEKPAAAPVAEKPAPAVADVKTEAMVAPKDAGTITTRSGNVLPAGYSPDKKVDENGAFYHPLMTKKKTEDENDITKLVENMAEETAAPAEPKSGVKVESMVDNGGLHEALKSYSGSTKNLDIMMEREVGYKSKSDNEINKLTQASGKNEEFLKPKSVAATSNFILGFIGTIIFGLIASAAWIFVGFMLYKDLTLDTLGYIMGIFLSFSVVTGYQKIGRYFDTKGVIVSFIMAIVFTGVSVIGYTGLAVFDTIRTRSDEFKNESIAVCEYMLLDESQRTDDTLQAYFGKQWGEIGILDGFKYVLCYDDAYDHLKSDGLIETWNLKNEYGIMDRFYQDLILSFVVVAITFVLAVANAKNWTKSKSS